MPMVPAMSLVSNNMSFKHVLIFVVLTFLPLIFSSLILPLHWVEPELRLNFQVSIKIEGIWYNTSSRLDLGSEYGLMIPSKTCKFTCGPSCINKNCACAPDDMLVPMMCPNGSTPNGSFPFKNGRTCAKCEEQNVTLGIDSEVLVIPGKSLGSLSYLVQEDYGCDSMIFFAFSSDIV